MASASLIVNQEHPMPMLGLVVQVDAVLTDAAEVKYDIFDDSAAITTTPIKSGTVTTGSGHLGTGRYGALDSVTSKAWKPTTTYKRARIEWRTKMAAADADYTLVVRTFEVLAATGGIRAEPVYALIQDVRDAGEPTATTDLTLRAALIEWREKVDRYCRQRFRTLYEERRLRGTGGSALFFSEPLVGADRFLPNAETSAEALGDFTIYGGTGSDRRNSRMEWAKASSTNIFAVSHTGDFEAGLTQKVRGVWGFVEEGTLEAPDPVFQAVVRGTRLTSQQAASGGSSGSAGGPIRAEETDGHRIEYAVASSGSSARSGLLSFLKDPAIRDALDLYRAPIAIAAPPAVLSSGGLRWP